jgi:DNA-binding MarR family transcriptional regulator
VADSVSLFPALVDEVLRTRGRLLSATASFGEREGLTGAQSLVLVAVARAENPPTVPQIGRSLGHTRQAVQRVVDVLAANGFVEFVDNPDHKRARRLVATPVGRAAQQAADDRSRSWAAEVTADLPAADLATTIATLRTLRTRLETAQPGTG